MAELIEGGVPKLENLQNIAQTEMRNGSNQQRQVMCNQSPRRRASRGKSNSVNKVPKAKNNLTFPSFQVNSGSGPKKGDYSG